MNTILTCNNLSKNFGSVKALSNINLELNSGKIIGLLGPNGSGKTTLIRLINGLITPSSGSLQINNVLPGIESKKVISYLPDKSYLPEWMRVRQTISLFSDFYDDFNKETAYEMLERLNIDPNLKYKSLSKGTKEKIQLILVMSRKAKLYCLDEPIGGVDPAARDYILNTIISNYNEDATVLLSTHLISDIENVLDEIIFIKEGHLVLYGNVDEIRERENNSIDGLFREVFKC